MKTLKLLSLLLLSASLLTACDNHGDPDPNPNPGPAAETGKGFYVINNGNLADGISSSITSYDYTTGSVTPVHQDAFMNANGVALGDGAQNALIYEGKMYVPMTISNIIWVLDAETLKVITMIRPVSPASGPRTVVAADGKVYVSMYSGYVCKIDAETNAIEATVATGPNSEQMAIADGKLYVTNSDGYNYNGGYADCSISIIDLATFTETKIKDISKVLNPSEMATNGTDVFVICRGNYNDVPSMVKKIVGTDLVDVTAATYIAVKGDQLFVINCPFGMAHDQMAFDIYNTKTLQKEGVIAEQTANTDSWVDAPAGVAVDPVTGDRVILSYTITETGYSQYKEPCYANIYDKQGAFKERITAGVGAIWVCFLSK